MQFPHPANGRAAGLPRFVETAEELRSLRQHLNDVVEGSAFKGSHRSGQFLKYIVEQVIAGHNDSLKERVIGVELFGRAPTYNTGDDAIVRLTASDVRYRLLQHYGTYRSNPTFRISLPKGTYVPEIVRVQVAMSEEKNSHIPVVAAAFSAPATEHSNQSQAQSRPIHEQTPDTTTKPFGTVERNAPRRSFGFRWSLALTLVNVVLVGSVFWMHWFSSTRSSRSIVPWSAFFSSQRLTHLITSDPNIATVQDLCGGSISVSDYANHNYMPTSSGVSPETLNSCRLILMAQNASFVDPDIAARISALAQRDSATINVQAARKIELADLKTDDNYILLGSPRSNPWSGLYNDQLDFHFVYDKASNREIIRNVRPRNHELPQYIPTAMGGGTGQSFAIIAVVQNLDQDGEVMLLAGADAEGTEAAGEFVTNLPRLSAALQNCNISPSNVQSHFQLLLKVDTMAGSPDRISMVACHLLAANPTH